MTFGKSAMYNNFAGQVGSGINMNLMLVSSAHLPTSFFIINICPESLDTGHIKSINKCHLP